MTWIDVIDEEEATGALKRLYEQVQSPDGHVDHILKAHGLRPATLRGHLSLYKAVLHSRPNGLSQRERELVGVCVSKVNACTYCVKHHTAGLARHVGDRDLAERLAAASVNEESQEVLTDREKELCAYARKLTDAPDTITSDDIDSLHEAGLDDATILDLNQIVAYFAYANRTVQGLGVRAEDEPLGLHPDSSRDDFRHQ
jgi:uncharacterized peroxidase-related enzyme